jgi:hypothetical protein
VNRIPVWAIVLAAIVAIGLLAFFIMKQVKGEDTQGVEYGGGKDAYAKRYQEKMSGGGGVSTGYGKNRPAAPASATQTRGGGYGGGYGGRGGGGYGGGGYGGR